MKTFLAMLLISTSSLGSPYPLKNSPAPVLIAKKKSKKAKKSKKIWKQSRSKSKLSGHRVSGQAIINYLGSGLGGKYEWRFSEYFSLGGGLSYTQAHLEGDASSGYKEIFDAITLRANAQGKIHYEWFYGGLNLNLIQVGGNYKLTDASSSVADIPFEGNHLHADLFVGTEFSLRDGFFLSIDWLGAGFPMSSQYKVDSNTEEELAVEFINAEPSLPNDPKIAC